ncbi:MAG: starch-binding protein [Paludibacteraceae bacterium]|nr:starch-binding protein [Paludibacteraceae bacterium]
MRKIFMLFAALTMVLSMFAATETVYFVNASSWTGTINAYAWTDGGAENQSWPGIAAAKEAEQIAGCDVYSYTAEADAYAKVIFNNGSAQTANLDWTAGKYYCKDGWYTKEEAEAKLAAPAEYESVYFVDNQGWGKANIYTWTPEVGTWPGVAMTKEAEQLAGYDVYSYTVEKGTSFGGVIFNNGSSQTANLVWTAGKYYVKDGWYTKEEAIEKLSAPVTPPVITYVLMGVAGDWTTGIALTANPDNANEYVLLDQTISEGDAVKVVTLTDGVATAWCGNVDEYSVEHSADDMGNIVLAPGKYNFYYKVAEDLIYIGAVAPELPTYDVTVADATVSTMGENIVLSGNWEEKLLTVSLWQGGATQGFGTYAAEDYAPIFLGTAELTPTSEGVYADNGDNTFTFTATANDAEGGIYNISVTGAIPAAEIEWISMPLEISNLTTTEMPVGDVTYLQLMGRNDMEDADVMLFLNDYTGEEKAYEVNVDNSSVTFDGMEFTVMDGSITKSVDPEKGDVFAGTVHAFVVDEEVGEMYVEFALTMYALPPIAIELEDVEIVVNEESAIAFFNATWEGSPLQVEVSGFEEVEFKEYEECWLSIGDDVNWVDAAAGPAAVIIEDGVAMLEGEFTSFATGKTYEVMLSGTLPVEEPEVVEPTYTENKLNTYAFGLESELNDTALVVTYRLNNSNATSVDVVVLKGDKVVATVPGTTTIGVNTVAVPTAILPQGFQLTWKVVVKGTSVEAPTQEAKTYDFYHPSGVDIDNNPENPTFGMLLVNEGMQAVLGEMQSNGEPYVSTEMGAGIYAFTPSFDLIPNGDQPGYNGGIEFTTGRADGAGTAYSPRRIRISEDGRIFVTSLNTDGNYLWEVNAANMNEWTPVFQGTLNDNKELITADSNFVAAPNNGFDVKGAGENLQLMMYSVNLPGITGAAMSGFRCDEYNLGTATSWATAPSKNWVLGRYAINYTGTQVVYDNEGGIWIASYRGTANDANPGLVHINADGVEDAKLVWSNVRQAGIRFNNDFTKLVVAGNNGAAKKATIYAVSKDANGAPVLTEETVIDMASVGNNLNDFAFDYAGNLYACGNSAEKLIGWAMPYSGVVETPAASKYAFHLGNLLEKTEMTGVVKRALTVGESTVVLTHEADGTANLYNVIDGEAYKVSQEGVIAVDTTNAGDLLAISDIAVTEDGKLVAINYMQTQSGDDYVDAGYKRGETRVYLWNDLAGDPAILFTSKMSSNWFRSKQGLTMAVKGTSDNMEIFTTGIHATKAWARTSSYRVIDGVYTEPDVNNNDYYHFYDVADAVALETTVGTQYELNASPLDSMNWILDAELINPVEIVEPETNNVEISTCVALTQDLGKKFNGATIVTVGEQHLMVAPYADAEGKLAGVKVLDITAGLDAATEVATADLDAAVEATAAATAVAVAENTLTITLVADATLYTLEVVLEEKPDYMVIEDNITNVVIDLEQMAIIGGPSTMWQVEVFLGLGQDNGDGTITLTEESSVAIMGFDARFIDGYAYDIDVTAPAAKAVLHVEDSGFFYEIKLDMTSAAPADPIVVVVEDATVQIDTIPLFGDAVDYALKMTANWTDTTDNTTYPVLVEVPVYYPEATEPFEMTCTVTIGGEGDDDPWLGFGEGPLTITTVDGVVTAKGIIANPYTGVAFDVTVSGKLPNMEMGIDNININAKPVKMIKNGMLIINKGGREFNAQGAMIK